MHQLSSAVGRVQLKYYDERMAEIQKAMNYFWDLLEGVPGIKPHRTLPGSGSTMGGWYNPAGHYCPEELDGLPVEKYCEAVRAEGVGLCNPGVNFPLHLHPLLHTADIYGQGKPTMLANTGRDIRQSAGTLPVSEGIPARAMMVPWFKHCRKDVIEEHAAAFRKVAENYKELLEPAVAL
jgi:perosamine synthetase